MKSEYDAEIQRALRQRQPAPRRETFFDDLRTDLASVVPDHSTERRRYLKRGLSVVPFAAAAVVVTLFLTTMPSSDKTKSNGTLGGVQLAAQVIANTYNSFAAVKGVSGSINDQLFPSPNGTAQNDRTATQFRLNNEGDLWQQVTCAGLAGSWSESYRSADGLNRYYSDGRCQPIGDPAVTGGVFRPNAVFSNNENGPTAVEVTDTFDANSLYRLGNIGSLVSTLRSLAQTDDTALTETSYNGRAAWDLSADIPESYWAWDPADHVDLIVDQATSFPVHAVRSNHGRIIEEISVDNLSVNPSFGPNDLVVSFPTRVKVQQLTESYQRTTPANVKTRVGYDLLTPKWLPDGFALSTISTVGYAGRDGSNLAWLTYRRGLQTLIVTTRSLDGAPAGDPLDFAEDPTRPQSQYATPVTLSAGAFGGRSANVLVQSSFDPHLWVSNDDLVLTVAGDISREQLIRIAESIS